MFDPFYNQDKGLSQFDMSQIKDQGSHTNGLSNRHVAQQGKQLKCWYLGGSGDFKPNSQFFIVASSAGAGEASSAGDGQHTRAPADVKRFSHLIPAR